MNDEYKIVKDSLGNDTMYCNGKLFTYTEYENGEEVKSILYDDNGKPSSMSEYENGEEVKSISYDDNGKPSSMSEYENGEEVKSILYDDNGKPRMMSEYENNEEVKSISYDNGKPRMMSEYENDEVVKSILYDDNGKPSSMSEYENDEETLNIGYKNNQIFSYLILENGEATSEVRLEDGKLIKIIEYNDDENYKTIIFENNKIKEIEEYKDDKLVNTTGHENIIDINELENKYISDVNNFIEAYNPDKIMADTQKNDIENTNAGYIYVLVNSSIKDMVKIGKTTRTPLERAKEISSSTGVPTPFVVAYESYFNDCSKAEKYIHSLLEDKDHRTSKQREFFNISSSLAIKVIMEAKEHFGE